MTCDLQVAGQGDPLAALILCGAHSADYVMVSGEWKVKNGEMVDADLNEIMSRHGIAAKRLREMVA